MNETNNTVLPDVDRNFTQVLEDVGYKLDVHVDEDGVLVSPTADELTNANPGLDGGANAVHYTPQTPTVAEQGIVRSNIGLGNIIVAALPTDIPDCEFWVDASNTGRDDGSVLSTWPDSGPNGYDLGFRNGAAILHENVLNGKPGVFFNNADMVTAPFLDSSFDSALTVIIVSICTTEGSRCYFGATDAPGTGPGTSSGFFGALRGNHICEFFGGAAGNIIKASAQNTGTPMVDVYRFDDTTLSIRHNRQNLRPDVLVAPIGFTNARLCLGTEGYTLGGDFNFVGYIFEVAVFSRVISDDEVRAIEQGFREKYDILNRPRLAFVGNSIYRGNAVGSTTTPPQIAMGLLTSSYDYDVASLCHEGDTMQVQGPIFGALIDADIMPGDNLTVVCELGINDLGNVSGSAAALWIEVQAWSRARKLAGVNKLLLHTISPADPNSINSGASFEGRRTTYNTSLRNGYTAIADGIVDIAANSSIGDEADTYDVTPGVHPSTYYLDGIHPTDAGVTIFATIITDAIQALFSVEGSLYAIILTSPDGTKWSVTIDNIGTLIPTAL